MDDDLIVDNYRVPFAGLMPRCRSFSHPMARAYRPRSREYLMLCHHECLLLFLHPSRSGYVLMRDPDYWSASGEAMAAHEGLHGYWQGFAVYGGA